MAVLSPRGPWLSYMCWFWRGRITRIPGEKPSFKAQEINCKNMTRIIQSQNIENKQLNSDKNDQVFRDCIGACHGVQPLFF